MTTVLVIGASQGIGLETVKQALDAGHHVKAFARSAESIAIDHHALTKIAGDALDDQALKAALDGIDVVIQTLGLKPGPEIMRRVDLFSRATRALLPAMTQASVKRLITVTGFGAGESRNRGGPLYRIGFNLFLRRAYDDKDVQEKLIRASDLDWTIVRPVILYDGARTGQYHVLTDPKRWRIGFISRSNVADFLVKQIDDDSYIHETPVITG
jgi:putative NADH-flavin reductase